MTSRDRTIWWIRRDLRLADNPALLAATGEGLSGVAGDSSVLAVYTLDDALLAPAGSPRRAYLSRSLAALDSATGGHVLLVAGPPQETLPALAKDLGVSAVHVAADFGPYGARRDAAVEAALGEVPLVRTGSPYAVGPGRVRKGDGEPYRVFTPFRRAWLDHGWRAPAPTPTAVDWLSPDDVGAAVARRAALDTSADIALPTAGEAAALARWEEFRDDALAAYDGDRDRPDRVGTSHLSIALKWGEIHPRTLLADLAGAARESATAQGATTFRSELAWREFYADVLHHHPASARTSLRDVVPDDVWLTGTPEAAALKAWTTGRTGYPFVDAGMRQLAETGWMHNRVRMVVASFLVKDLHVRWQAGARHFMTQLIDGDLASNSHNWQWVAGTGTDAAPFFRVFNPVTQGRKFDPDGAYVRRWIPELRGVPGAAVHEPWKLREQPEGYPAPVVDHAREREVTLEAYGRR